MRTTVSFSLSPELTASLDDIACVAGVSRSDLVEALLRDKHVVGHVCQRTETDCEVATVAMLAGIPYAEAARHDQSRNLLGTRGCDCEGMRRFLDSATGKPWKAMATRLPLSSVALPDNAAVLIRHEDDRSGHWIAVFGGIIHDPRYSNGSRLAVYHERDWIALCVITAQP